MIKTFTQNDVIRYAYDDEVTSEEKIEMECALLFENSLREFCDTISNVKKSLDKMTMEPSDKAIENILLYSRTFATRS